MNIPQFSGYFSIQLKDKTKAGAEDDALESLYKGLPEEAGKQFFTPKEDKKRTNPFLPTNILIKCSDQDDQYMIDGLNAINTIYPNAFEKVTLLSNTEKGTFIQAEKPVVNPSPPVSGDF